MTLRNIVSNVESSIESLISNTRKKFCKGMRSFFKNQMNITRTMTLDDRKDVILFSIYDDSDFLKH